MNTYLRNPYPSKRLEIHIYAFRARPDVGYCAVVGTDLCAEAWESVGVVDGDWGGSGAWSTTTGSTSSWATSWSTASAAGTITTWGTTEGTALTALTTAAWSITASTSTASGVTLGWGLNEALVNVDDLLLLALTGTLGLSGRGSDEVLLLLLLELLSLGPGLVLLGTLVGLAGGGSLESVLLLSLLDEVVGVRDVVVSLLLLGGAAVSVDWGSLAVLLQGDLLVTLGNSLTGLLVVELGLAGLTTPSVSSLLGGVTDSMLASSSECRLQVY